MRQIKRIIIHYLGPGSGAHFRTAEEAVAAVRGWHQAQGWRDIGYHWVISQSGDVAPGRPEAEVGAHAYGDNAETLGILCCVGVEDRHVPPDMLDALADLIAERAEEHGIPLDRAHVIGHRDVPGEGGATACPGQLYPMLPQIIERARMASLATVELDGEHLGEALLVDGRSYLPVRALAEALGVSVAWDPTTKTVRLSRFKQR
ncbi:MAG: N-acetylmuramoyl-L-alanine amidase [Vulcanimicrobiota bacterium]